MNYKESLGTLEAIRTRYGKAVLLDLMIADEIECQAEDRDDDFLETVMQVAREAYLHSESISIWSIVRVCLEYDTAEELKKASVWDILDGTVFED